MGHKSTAKLLLNLASTLQQRGDAKQAIKYYEHALKVSTKIYGKHHEEIDKIYMQLESLYT